MGETAAVLGGRQTADRQNGPGECDELLVARVRAGDREAFEEIYDRYARGILAFCVHMLGSREGAEDALQQTFVSAYRALRRGESSIALRPWLYTIARNRCLSELRARRDSLGMGDLMTDGPAVEGLADQVQRREDLREMLDDMQRLPADQRAALVLFELGDHPQKDIATVLGVRTEKVKALVFQAREALVRGRAARERPCRDIREQLATLEGRIPARSMLRAHIERCPGCQSFEHEVRHQRAALALILPVALTGELKRWILGSSLHSGGAVAAGVGACGGGGVAASACGGGAIVGGATVVGGMGGTGAISAATAGGIAGTGAGAAVVATGAPVVAVATGLTAVGETVGGLSATGVVAKILTAAAIATVAASSSHTDKLTPPPPAASHSAAPKGHHRLLASATPLGVRVPARDGGTAEDVPLAATGVPPNVTATPLGSSASASSSTSGTSTGATATSTPGTSATGGSTGPSSGGTAGTGTASTPLATGGAPASGGASTAAAPPAASTGGTAPASSSGAPSTSAATGASAPAATDSGSSPATAPTSTTATAAAPPPAGSGGGADATSPPSTTSGVAAGGTAATGSAAAVPSGTSSTTDGATAPSTSTTAAVQSATAAGPGSTDAASGPDASAVPASGS